MLQFRPMSTQNPHYDHDEMLQTRHDLKRPSRYRVLLINDDYSTYDFVVEVLMTLFNKTSDQATAITQAVHEQGQGVCGTYSREIAETKIEQVRDLSRSEGHPLRAVMEEE